MKANGGDKLADTDVKVHSYVEGATAIIETQEFPCITLTYEQSEAYLRTMKAHGTNFIKIPVQRRTK